MGKLWQVETDVLAENEDVDKKGNIPGMAKHFVVCIETIWSSGKKIQFLVVRHGWKFVTGVWLQWINKTLVSLVFYIFIGDTVSGDSVSENWSAFRFLAPIVGQNILRRCWSVDELEGLGTNFKIGF